MGIFQRIKKGVRAGLMAMTNTIEGEMKILKIVEEFEKSSTRKLMLTGERYYKCDNDILKREMTRTVRGSRVPEPNKANNRLAHSKYHAMVDEKISYFLSKPYTIEGEDEAYCDKVKDVLGRHFSNKLNGLGYEASNKGIGWLHPYIDEYGVLKFEIIPAEQITPIWADAAHTKLSAIIRKYSTFVWEYSRKREIVHLEHWTADSVRYYIQTGNALIADTEKEHILGHYLKNGAWMAWGRVPFVCFKNNWIEMPDIGFIKSLIDSYDKSRSDVANYIEEVNNLILVLKGYSGEHENVVEFMRGVNEDRVILIDDPSEGGVEALNPTVDITAIREHYEQLKRDICEDGQSVDKDLDKYGASPSGVALGFMYSGLDLKCNALEAEFKNSFEYLLNFINIYLAETGQGTYTDADIRIIFNRAMRINEAETIRNVLSLRDFVSDKTLLARVPYIDDVDKELEQIDEEQGLPPTVPMGGDNG